MAISAAWKACAGVPPSASQSAAAAIALDTPTSAWQPPIAAEMVAPFLKKVPTSPATSRKSTISSSVTGSSEKQTW